LVQTYEYARTGEGGLRRGTFGEIFWRWPLGKNSDRSYFRRRGAMKRTRIGERVVWASEVLREEAKEG